MCLVLAVAACTPRLPEEPAQPPTAGWPTSLSSFTIAWTAEPGIDLATDGAAIAVRAYVESYFLAIITKNDKYLYPGFADAVEPDQSGGPAGTENLHPEIRDSDPSVYIGTAHHHVLSISRSDRDVTLTACAYLYGAAIERPNGKYNAIVGKGFAPGPGIYPLRIGLRAPEETRPELRPQRGPLRAPFDNVFGDWKITSNQGGYFSYSSWAEYDRDLATCTERADTALSNRHLSPVRPYPGTEFPTLPATPGWPEKPAS
jgi:hypothetical protein